MADRKRKAPPDDEPPSTPEERRSEFDHVTPRTDDASQNRGSGGDASRQQDEDRGGSSGQGGTHIRSQKTRLSSDFASHMPSPAVLLSSLICPLCHSALRDPTTLHCGHSLCAHHVADPPDKSSDPPPQSSAPPSLVSSLPLCPLADCSAKPGSSSPNLHIPASSRVRYRPAPAVEDTPVASQPKTVPEPRLDVTLNKVLLLTQRAKQALEVPASHPEDSESESDPEPSSHSSALDQPYPPRSRKRRRRHRSPDDDDDDDDGDNLVAHLKHQAVRQRTLRHDEPLLPSFPSADAPSAHSRDAILSRFQKDLLAELTCEICFVLLYQPITTPCQHTFCAKCLQRSLDHSSACPLCRQHLLGFTYFQDHPPNKTVLSIILQSFPMVYRERGEALAAEERDARLDTPIFVCQLSFPGMPTLLHFFEPRYRLMLRRCLESPSPRFGMIMPPKPGAGSPLIEYGTMLEIRSVQMLPDGRSMVETCGTFRFRILERGTLDGYMVGRIERIDDYPEDLPASSLLFPPPLSPSPSPPPITRLPSSSLSSSVPSSSSAPPPGVSTNTTTPVTTPPLTPVSVPIHPNSPSNEDLMSTCRSFLERLQEGTAPWVVQRLSSTVGAMPTDPSAFSFWVALVLPIDEHEKAKLLPLRSARLRLLLLAHWIEQLNDQWYAFVWRVAACLVWTAFVLTVSRFCGFV